MITYSISGNFSATLKEMIENASKLTTEIDNFKERLKKLSKTFAVWDMASNYVGKFHDALEGLSVLGISLN